MLAVPAPAPPAVPPLLPPRLDRVARRVAPAWPSDELAGRGTAGTGRRLLRPLLVVLAVATVVQSGLHVVDVAVFDLRVDRWNADHDGSVAGWLGTVLTWSVAGAALLLAVLAPGVRTPMAVLSGLCAFLSLDDMLQLHEVVARVALRSDTFAHSGYTFWPLVYLPLLCVIGWLVLRSARSLDVPTGRHLVAGLACLAAAVLLEATAPVLYALGSDHGQPLYETEVTLEEALETFGWGLIAVGLVAAVVDLLAGRGAAAAEPGPGSASLAGPARPAGAHVWPQDGERRRGDRRGARARSGAGRQDGRT